MNPLLFVAGIVLVITFLILFLSHHLDSDFTLHVYENILGRKRSEVLRGKVAWITGASSGIGEQLAYQLVKCGCKLVLSARRMDELERVKDKCADIAVKSALPFDKENDILVLPLDLKDYANHEKLASRVINHFNKIDILVNNAGQSMCMMVEKTPFHVDQEIVNINFFGAISLTKAVLPYMIERKQGQITVVSSCWGKFGYHGVAPYVACKFALLGYFRSLRREVSNRNIKIVTILPGPIKTNARSSVIRNPSDTDEPDIDLDETYSKEMSAERCSYLMTVAMVNDLKEAWISETPTLTHIYLAQYMPTVFEWAESAFNLWIIHDHPAAFTTISSPEPTFLLVSTETRGSGRSHFLTRSTADVQLSFKPVKTLQKTIAIIASRFSVLTKRNVGSGDEIAFSILELRKNGLKHLVDSGAVLGDIFRQRSMSSL